MCFLKKKLVNGLEEPEISTGFIIMFFKPTSVLNSNASWIGLFSTFILEKTKLNLFHFTRGLFSVVVECTNACSAPKIFLRLYLLLFF